MKQNEQKEREKWVMESLIRSGYCNIRRGDDPPDLLLNDTIAIEVSSLVEYVIENGQRKPVTEASSGFRGIVRGICNEFPNPDKLPCAIINYTFFRPLPKASKTKNIIRKMLNGHLPHMSESRIYEMDKMEFSIDPTEVVFENRFVLGFMSDGNRGASSLVIAMENLPPILHDKELILRGYGKIYDENWLALVNETAFPTNDPELGELRTHLNLTSTFDKILIFTPYNHFHFNTLYNKSGKY